MGLSVPSFAPTVLDGLRLRLPPGPVKKLFSRLIEVKLFSVYCLFSQE